MLRERLKADCTRCRYCMPCPFGVDIPDVLAALNNASMWDDPNAVADRLLERRRQGVDLCTECGQCLDDVPAGDFRFPTS